MNDLNTGPMHIAVAMKTPTITICVPKYVEEWHPYDTSRHRVVSKQLTCKKCEKDRCDEKACIKEISVEDVIRAVKALYLTLKAAHSK